MTAIENIPAVEAFPVAVNCVDERNIVISGEPANSTCAPGTKLAPLIVRAKAPTAVVCGARLPRAGIGFSSVTVMLAETFESAALTAFRVTVFGMGKLPG